MEEEKTLIEYEEKKLSKSEKLCYGVSEFGDKILLSTTGFYLNT